VCVIFGRAEVCDYVDVDAILTSGRYTEDELVNLAMDHDPGFDRIWFVPLNQSRSSHVPPSPRVFGTTSPGTGSDPGPTEGRELAMQIQELARTHDVIDPAIQARHDRRRVVPLTPGPGSPQRELLQSLPGHQANMTCAAPVT
jgi:hypothetical protein